MFDLCLEAGALGAQLVELLLEVGPEVGEPLLAVAAFALDLGARGVALGPGGGLGGAQFAELLAKRVDLSPHGVDLLTRGGGGLLGAVGAGGLGSGSLDGSPGSFVGFSASRLGGVEFLGQVVALALEASVPGSALRSRPS